MTFLHQRENPLPKKDVKVHDRLCLGTSEIYYQFSQNPLLPIKGKYVMMKIARSLEVNMTLFKC